MCGWWLHGNSSEAFGADLLCPWAAFLKALDVFGLYFDVLGII